MNPAFIYLLFSVFCAFLIFLCSTEKKRTRFFQKALIVYIVGFIVLNILVLMICKAELPLNSEYYCKHGWYSEKNYIVKIITIIWTVGPVALIAFRQKENTD